jgi:uncharacterized protein (TIGR02145 family)
MVKLKKRYIPLMVLGLILSMTNNCRKEEIPDVQDTVADIDNNVYKTITIGTQTWMAENLKTTRYNNGDPIGTTIPPTKDISEESKPKYQWPNGGIESNIQTWGRFYTWYAVKDSRGICPAGWHVPSDSEWDALTGHLGGSYIAGYKLMDSGDLHWINNENGNNVSGFTALGGGARSPDGSFFGFLSSGSWWSSSEDLYSEAIGLCRELYNFTPEVSSKPQFKEYGLSIRCVKTCCIKK